MRVVHTLLLSMLCGSALLAPSFVQAAPPAPNQGDATSLKAIGDRAMDEARPADALAAYEKSYAQKPDPALLYNQARAHLALTNHPEALRFLERFQAEAPPSLQAKLPGLEKLVHEVRGKVHRLSLVVNVPGAQIRLRDATLGTAPLAGPVAVNAGEALLEVRASRYETEQRKLTLAGNAESSIDVKLERADTRGTVYLRSPQPGVRVSVQGAPRGSLPYELSVEQGTYAIRLQKDGFEPLDTSIVVVAGERRERTLSLAKHPAIYTRWWFWTGIGVVAAGAAVTAVLLTTERSPDSGSIAPGQVVRGFSF